jgi:retron-type reverse transcriptase
MNSTTTALLPIATNIAIGFNEPKPAKRTALVSIDISSAFDGVNHDLLLGKIAATPLHSNVTRWIAAYLSGCMAVCLFQGAVSRQHTCHSGVPQGSVISPHLFNFFVSDFPSPAEVNELYADDFSLSESSSDVDALGPLLTHHLSVISKWAKDNKLEISAAKSHVTLFTPHTKEVNRDIVVTIDGV